LRKELIKAKEEDIRYLEARIKAEKERTESNEAVILNLKTVLENARKLFKLHSEKISSLQAIASGYMKVESIQCDPQATDPHSQVLCDAIRLVNGRLVANGLQITATVTAMATQSNQLWLHIAALNQELVKKNSIHKLSNDSLNTLTISKKRGGGHSYGAQE
jgi:hypothetical protein